mmetsp:Transcript_8105/g.29914  ORF Transcript_8105/g.29914 Transcript_8105/m.29914 type:complete len:200 (-) Transcript_8105:97-696(-)
MHAVRRGVRGQHDDSHRVVELQLRRATFATTTAATRAAAGAHSVGRPLLLRLQKHGWVKGQVLQEVQHFLPSCQGLRGGLQRCDALALLPLPASRLVRGTAVSVIVRARASRRGGQSLVHEHGVVMPRHRATTPTAARRRGRDRAGVFPGSGRRRIHTAGDGFARVRVKEGLQLRPRYVHLRRSCCARPQQRQQQQPQR